MTTSLERSKITPRVRWRGTPNLKPLGATFPKPHILSTLGLLPVQVLRLVAHGLPLVALLMFVGTGYHKSL